MISMQDNYEDVSFKELLGYSIEGEKAAHKAYLELSKKISGLPSDRFESLAEDELKHKEKLIEMHEDEFGDGEYVVPEGEELPPHEGSLIDIDPNKVKVLTQAVEAAIEAEKRAYRIYKHLAKKSEKHSDLFNYIAMMEKGHKESLEGEKNVWEDYEKKKGKETSLSEIDLLGT